MALDKRGNGPSLIEFRLDPASGIPPYLQLVRQVEHALRLGLLRPGDQLPRVKDVVASVSVNANTVLKAYKQLEHKNLVVGRPGQGTFIGADAGHELVPDLQPLRRSLAGWLSTATAAGLDEQGIVALFSSTLREFTAASLVDDRAVRGRT